MFVKSQDGAVVLNNDKVTEYSTDSKYDGRYKVAALVGENRVVIGRYSTKEKCRMAISMLMDCYTMNLLFERGQDENPRDLVCEYVADQPLGVFEMPQEDEIEQEDTMNKEFYRGEIFYIRNESEYSGNVQGGVDLR